jgi:hypothetical protein
MTTDVWDVEVELLSYIRPFVRVCFRWPRWNPPEVGKDPGSKAEKATKLSVKQLTEAQLLAMFSEKE